MNYTNSSSTNDTVTVNKPPIALHVPISVSLQVLLLSISTAALLANVSVCVSILSVSHLRRSIVNCFVISLCCTQILVDVVIMPMFCFANHHFLYGYAVALAVMSYITSLLALTFDRYLAVKLPLRYRGLMWYSRAVRIVLFCWAISCILQVLPVLWEKYDSELLHRVYLSFIAFTFLFIPLCLVIYAYTSILKEIILLARRDNKRKYVSQSSHLCNLDRKKSETLTENTEVIEMESLSVPSLNDMNSDLTNSSLSFYRSSIRSFNSQRSSNRSSMSQSLKSLSISHYKRELKSALLFVFVGGMYGATWIPVLIMTLFRIFGREDLIPVEMSEISIFIMAGNSLIDPLIYGIYMKDVRERLIQMLYNFRVGRKDVLMVIEK